jgi:hypothetical protein
VRKGDGMKKLFLICIVLLFPVQLRAAVLVFKPDGTYTTKTGIEAAAATAEGKRVVVTSAYTLTDNLTWPSDRSLEIEKGGLLTIVSGKNLAIKGPFQAGPYQVFAGSGSVTFGSSSIAEAFPNWFGKDAAAVMKAIAAFSVVRFIDYTISSPITVSTPVKFVGGKVTQTALDANAFIVTSSGVAFEGVEIIGNNGTHTAKETTAYSASSANLSTKYCGIYADGAPTVRLESLKIINTKIHGFHYAIRALWNNGFTLANSHLYNCFIGVYGGSGWEGDLAANQNKSDLSYNISNSRIIVEYGLRVYARPITLPLNGGSALISSNMLRGGGMAFENTLSAGTMTRDKRLIITGNDCDTSISGGDVISNNVIDANLAPVDRGPQYGTGVPPENAFWQAIEPSPNATVTGNIIRNYAMGISNLGADGPVITGNSFVSIGRTVSNMAAVIGFRNDNPVDTVSGTIISNNKFINIGALPILNLQWGVAHPYFLSNIIFDSNIIEGTDSYGMLVSNVKNLRVTNNIVTDCNRRQSDVQAFFLWESRLVEGYYSGNSITRTLKTGLGTYSAFANQSASVFGYNSFAGLRATPYTNPELVKYTSTVFGLNGTPASHLRDHDGTPVGAIVPLFRGEMVQDSSTGDFYIGFNTNGSTQWKKLTP